MKQGTVNHLVVGSIPTQAARKDSFLSPAHRGRSVNLLLDHPRGCGEDARTMGQQSNKVIKRRRRRAYLERKKDRVKIARAAASKKKAKK